jgi:GDP-4-dehydro-6-deoxy-D-mannose reductase
MRVLITGGSGFAGSWLADACRLAGDDVVALSSADADLLDPAAARAAVAAGFDAVYHLAALAHVGQSWQDPAGTLRDNLTMTLNVLEAVRHEAPSATVIAVASGELYGPPESLPVTEAAPMRPQNPYAVSKASADLLAQFYADGHGLRVIRPRPFNHAGPRQQPNYAIASFARQLAAGLEAGDDPVVLRTGNPDTRRDYTDVRDVVRAYRTLAERGEPGVFNVCSGRTASAAELVQALGRANDVEVVHDVDQSLVRGHEVMEVRGSAERLRAATGWEPEIPLESTLRDTVVWWREQLRGSQATDGSAAP